LSEIFGRRAAKTITNLEGDLKETEAAMKLLVAVDGSKYSDAAVQMLISKIRKEDTEVLVLQVVEPKIFSAPPQMSAGYEPELAEMMKEQFKMAQQTVDRAAATLKTAGFNARGRVVEAETRAGILDLASEWQADLIVLGSHGRKGVQRFVLGSVAEAVARGAYCSVLIVRAA
jgi:nucleotide-binding universal stress UspA family protein